MLLHFSAYEATNSLDASPLSICVSVKQGQDTTECYQQQRTTCCATLTYATSNVPTERQEDDLHIELHGGETHLLNQTLNIRQSVTLFSTGTAVLTLNETNSMVEYPFNINLVDVRLTLENIEFLNMKDVVYVTKVNAQIAVRNCRFVCQGCSSTFFRVTASATQSELTIANSFFCSEKYLLYSTSPEAKITISDSIFTGSQIYMKNLKVKVNNISLTLTNITATGVFKYYTVKQYGYFKELRIDRFHLRNTQIQQQAVFLKYNTNKELPNNARITNFNAINSSNAETNLFDIQRCKIHMENISLNSNTLTSTIKLIRVSGNLSSINIQDTYMRHLVVAEYSTINVQNVSVQHCRFESVTYKDFRYGRYSPMTHKGLLFAEFSQVTCSFATLADNDFGWNIVYLTESTLDAKAMLITRNSAKSFMIENADNSQFILKDSQVTENTIRSALFHNFYAILNISDVKVIGNKNSSFFRFFTLMFAESTHLTISNFDIRRNDMTKCFELRNSPTILRSVTMIENTFYGNFVFFIYKTLDATDIVFHNNRGFHEKNSVFNTRNSVFAFETSISCIRRLRVIGSRGTEFLIRSLKSVTVAEDFIVTDNWYNFHIIHFIEGAFTLNRGLFRHNWALSVLMMELADTSLTNIMSSDNIITGNSTRFLTYDAYVSKVNATGIHQLQLRNVSVKDRLDHPLRNSAATFSITAYFVKLLLQNVSIVLENYQVTGFEVSFQGTALFYHKISGISISCPTGTRIQTFQISQNIRSTFRVMCPQCKHNHYSIERGEIILKDVIREGEKGIKEGEDRTLGFHTYAKKNIQCHPCPVGGECERGITKSKSNYYGYVKASDASIEYITCPVEYCCSNIGNPCTSYSTCNSNRSGVLCGQCNEGFQESFFTNNCIALENCKHHKLFWIMYGLTALGVTLVLCFMDNIKTILLVLPKTFYKALCKKNIDKGGESNNKTVSIYGLTKRTVIEAGGIENKAYESVSSSQPASSQPVYESVSGDSESKEHSVTANLPRTNPKEDEDCSEGHDLPYTMQGVFNSMLSFYQIKSLIIVVSGPSIHNSNVDYLIKKITDVFNLQVFLNLRTDVCPMQGLNAVTKRLIRFVLFSLVTSALVALIWVLCLFYNYIRRSEQGKSLSELLLLKLEICYLRIITFGYKNIATVALVLVTCVSINDSFVLFINGNIQCFTYQQYIVFAFIGLWVLPLPFSLYASYNWYRDLKISFRELLFCLTLPPFTFVIGVVTWRRKTNIDHNKRQFQRIREMYEEPYRLKHGSTEKYVFWEHWRLIQRLVLSIITTYLKNPLWKIYMSSPVILSFFLVYLKVKPFKKTLFLLHWLEICSLIGLCYQMLYNLLKGYIYLYDAPNNINSDVLVKFFVYTEFLFSPLAVFVLYLVGNLFYKHIHQKLFRGSSYECHEK